MRNWSGAVTRLRSGRATPLLSGKVIALLGASGGSGCSTLAVNFATALAREYRWTLLVDLAVLQGGDLSALLDLKPAHTLADLCHSGNRLDPAMVEDRWWPLLRRQVARCASAPVTMPPW